MKPGSESGTNLDFVRAHLDLTRRYADAIDRGDLRTAESLGIKLNRGTIEFSRLVSQLDGKIKGEPRREIEEALKEVRSTQDRLIGWLEPARARLEELLLEIRRGRQLVNGYRSGRMAQATRLEIVG
jgi:hypothetical protein